MESHDDFETYCNNSTELKEIIFFNSDPQRILCASSSDIIIDWSINAKLIKKEGLKFLRKSSLERLCNNFLFKKVIK